MRIEELVEWTPRSANREADAVANGGTSGFNPGLEVKIDDKVLEWIILPQVFCFGEGGRGNVPGCEEQGRAARQVRQAAEAQAGRTVENCRSVVMSSTRRWIVQRVLSY